MHHDTADWSETIGRNTLPLQLNSSISRHSTNFILILQRLHYNEDKGHLMEYILEGILNTKFENKYRISLLVTSKNRDEVEPVDVHYIFSLNSAIDSSLR